MFVQAIRGIAIVFVSLLIAFAGVIGVELMSSILHPAPPGIDMSNIEACRQHVARYPTGVLFLCAIGWWLTVLASSWMATQLAPNRHPVYGIAVGVILLALAVFNMAMLPYPTWFWINVIAFPATCLAGVRLAQRRLVRE